MFLVVVAPLPDVAATAMTFLAVAAAVVEDARTVGDAGAAEAAAAVAASAATAGSAFADGDDEAGAAGAGRITSLLHAADRKLGSDCAR